MIAERYGVSLGAVIKRTIPCLAVFCAFALVYYNVLCLVAG